VTPALLVETLRARGVVLRAVGDRLRVRPATAVTPDELEALRQFKPEVMALLARVPPITSVTLDPVTIREVLGPKPDPHDVAIITFEVVETVAQLEREIQAGAIGQRPRLVRGLPLGLWLDLSDVARLLRAGTAPR
jgi:hypothetical protein